MTLGLLHCLLSTGALIPGLDPGSPELPSQPLSSQPLAAAALGCREGLSRRGCVEGAAYRDEETPGRGPGTSRYGLRAACKETPGRGPGISRIESGGLVKLLPAVEPFGGIIPGLDPGSPELPSQPLSSQPLAAAALGCREGLSRRGCVEGAAYRDEETPGRGPGTSRYGLRAACKETPGRGPGISRIESGGLVKLLPAVEPFGGIIPGLDPGSPELPSQPLSSQPLAAAALGGREGAESKGLRTATRRPRVGARGLGRYGLRTACKETPDQVRGLGRYGLRAAKERPRVGARGLVVLSPGTW